MKFTAKHGTLASLLFITLCAHPGIAQSATKPETPEPNDMPEASDTLEAMVVTGSAIAEPLKDAPVRTELIDRQLIETTAMPNLAQIIEYTPGIRVDNSCSNCNTQNIQLLGLPQSYIAILQDGMPTFSGLAGVYGIEQIPTGLIDRIEVVKGGGSTLYGPSAVAGVINIIPREPVRTGGSIELGSALMQGEQVGGELGTNFFGLYDLVIPEKHLALTFYGGYNGIQATDLNSDGFTDISERELFSGGLRATWNPHAGSKFTFDYFISDEYRRGGETGAAFAGPPNLAAIAEELFSLRQVASLKWDQEISQTLTLQTAYAYSATDRDSYYGGTVALGSPGDPGWTPRLGFGETSSDLHFGYARLIHEISDEHRLTYGVEYRREHLVDEQQAIGRNLDATFGNFGILAQHRWVINDVFTAEYGGRADFHSLLNDPVFSPRANLMIQATDSLRIRNSVSWGFRAPEVFDEDLHISNVGGELQSISLDPNLREETSVTYSIAPEWQINDQWRLEVNGFYTQLSDTFTTVPTDDPTEFLKINGADSSVAGVEVNLGYRHSDTWRTEFSWTQQQARFADAQDVLGGSDDPNDNLITANRFVRTPESLGLLRLFYTGPHFEAFLGAKITGPMDVPRIVSDPSTGDLVGNRLERSPWFFNLDLGISKRMEFGDNTALTLTAGVRNLLDDFQDDLEVGAFRDANYVYGPVFPRTYYVGARWDF